MRHFCTPATFVIPFLTAVLVANGVRSAEPTADSRFVIVQPGYPGSTEEAESFVSDLAKAISRAGGLPGLTGEYHNDEKAALEAIASRKPAFGMVSLGFYLAHRDDLGLEPLLQSRPSERFYLAARKGQALSLGDLAGKTVAGTPFQEKEFVERILFGKGAGGGPPARAGNGSGKADSEKAGPEKAGPEKAGQPGNQNGKAPSPGAGNGAGAPGRGEVPGAGRLADLREWKILPTEGFTKGIRDISKGKVEAVLLTEREKRAIGELPAGQKLEVFYQTEEFPTALLVRIGEGSGVVETASAAARALVGLKDSPGGKEVLSTMGIEGFTAADRKQLTDLVARYGAGNGAGNGARKGAQAGAGTGEARPEARGPSGR